MKAERRHELKTNALAKNLESAPAFFQKHGTLILLGITFALLIYIVIQHQREKAKTAAETAARNLGGALYALNELRSIPGRASPEQLAQMRKEYSHDADLAITEVLSNSDDPKVRATALVAKGDLNWELASFPALPGAATRPEILGFERTPDEYLTAAADAYNQVLDPPLNTDEPSVTAARFSLAKIAENRSQWDEAKKYYQKILDDPAAGKEFQEWAQNCIDGLKALEKPVYVGTSEASVAPPQPVRAPEKLGPFAPPNLSTAPAIVPPAATQPTITLPPTTQPVIAAPTTTTVPSTPVPTPIPTTRPSPK